jgi:eukaryotic-like serine/threonine-protein kinase
VAVNLKVARDPSPSSDWAGTDRYRVVRRIGEGAMGVVYEAFDRERAQTLALKTLPRFDAAALYRFKQEFRALADLHHVNLVRLHELVAIDSDHVFFTMELVRGVDFLAYAHATARPGRPATDPPRQASPADIQRLRPALRQLAEGLQAVHAAGKLHRDIKPSNILVTADGRVVLLDFGVATELARDPSAIEEHGMVGTVAYMAPELALDEALTPACDWYSVGVLLFEALTGRPPFEGSAVEVLSQKNTREARPPSELVSGIPADLDSLCAALLALDPEKRPPGTEILRRLGATRSNRPFASSPPAVDADRNTMLVGREAELSALRAAFDEMLSGRCVTIRLGGESGMGKSAIARYFLDGLTERGEAVVLRGRAYERESVPYKAFDSVVDVVSRLLMQLEEAGEPLELPDDVGLLARLFPVLRRVPSIGDSGGDAIVDPHLVRVRAFVALRELFASLARRRPLVLFIDDAHWGDVDSASLLLELVRPPTATALLIVTTHREGEALSSPFLIETDAHWPEKAERRDLTVGPLDADGAQRLAVALLGFDDEDTRLRAIDIAKESGGSPFLVEELARSVSGLHRVVPDAYAEVDAPSCTLEEMVGQRVARLPNDARQLLEIIALGGRPMPASVVGRACETGDSTYELIALLSSRRFVQIGLRNGDDVVETRHDRIRETIVAQLPADVACDYHARLARVLEATPGTDPEAITVHLLGAGEKDRATEYAERAAEQAAEKLAFDRAARLFRLTLENTAPSSPDARRLRARLGNVLEWAGRGPEAAQAYQEAAVGAPGLERAGLERAAAVELLASGRIDEGGAVLRRVLTAVDLEAPRSTLGAVVGLIFYGLLLRVRGLKFVERGPDDVQPQQRARIDALFAAAIGFDVVDVILGACMTARHLVEALRSGDRFQVLRATALHASFLASTGGKPRALEAGAVDLARRLAEREERPEGKALFDGSHGIALYLRGHWKEALALLDASHARVQTHDHSAGWQSNAHVFGCWALNFLGEHAELARRHARLLADAERRGDMYTSVQLRDGSLAVIWLAGDNPDAARRHARESMELWPHTRYLLQHWHRMFGEAEIELYVGEGAQAYARVERDAKAVKKSLLLNVQHMRAQTMFIRGRCAIASIAAQPALKSRRLAEARTLARRLEKEGMGWTAPFAAILSAGAASVEGDVPAAAAHLRSSIERAEAAKMGGYARAARHQLGMLMGGDEGKALVVSAEESMAAQGVVVPHRFASTLAPGRWRSAGGD